MLSAKGGTQLANSVYWSSTNENHGGYYFVHMSNGSVGGNIGDDLDYVRPVLASW